jgi:LEA14-like dessication related protein
MVRSTLKIFAEKNRVAGLVGMLVLCCAGCRQPAPPEYLGFTDLQVSKLNMQESVVSANVHFYNPNHFNLQLKRAEMNIFLNDKLAEHYILDSTVNIPRLDSFYVPVSLKINLSGLMNNALQMLFSNRVKVNIDGKVKLKSSGLTFNRPFVYEGSQRLDSLLNLVN